MGDVVNLRRVRKAKKRAADDRAAEANRLSFGQTKAERHATELRQALDERVLDGHRRAPTDGDA